MLQFIYDSFADSGYIQSQWTRATYKHGQRMPQRRSELPDGLLSSWNLQDFQRLEKLALSIKFIRSCGDVVFNVKSSWNALPFVRSEIKSILILMFGLPAHQFPNSWTKRRIHLVTTIQTFCLWIEAFSTRCVGSRFLSSLVVFERQTDKK